MDDRNNMKRTTEPTAPRETVRKAAAHQIIRSIYRSVAALVIVTLVTHMTAFADEKKGHMKEPEDCPPGTKGKARNCREYWGKINKEALRQGYKDSNRDGVADFLQNYTINDHDCADVAAEVACVADKSECIEQKSKQLVGSGHSDNQVAGIGECDFTPMQIGGTNSFKSNRNNNFAVAGGIKSRSYAFRHPPAPDPGETVDPAYTCAMNGAHTGSVSGSGGGSGGGGSGGAFGSGGLTDLMFVSLLQSLLNGQNNQPPPQMSLEQVAPTPSPTPLPTSTPSGSSKTNGVIGTF